MKLNVSARAIAAAGLFVSNEKGRYYLHGVYVTPHPTGGVVVSATTGEKLCLIHDKDGSADRPILLKMDFSDKRLKDGKSGEIRLAIDAPDVDRVMPETPAVIHTRCEGGELGPRAGFITASEIDGSYPWEGLKRMFRLDHIDAPLSGSRCINPARFVDCGKAAMLLGAINGMLHLSRYPDDPSGPFLARPWGIGNALFLVMPGLGHNDKSTNDFAWAREALK